MARKVVTGASHNVCLNEEIEPNISLPVMLEKWRGPFATAPSWMPRYRAADVRTEDGR